MEINYLPTANTFVISVVHFLLKDILVEKRIGKNADASCHFKSIKSKYIYLNKK